MLVRLVDLVCSLVTLSVMLVVGLFYVAAGIVGAVCMLVEDRLFN